MKEKFLKIFIILLPLGFLLSIFLTNFNEPFRTVDEDNGYLFGGVARSHLLLGLQKTYGQDFFYEGLGKEPIPYLHHPPGVGISLAIILKFLNFGDLDKPFWQERILPTFYHLGSYFLFFFLSLSFFKSLKAAFISLLIFVLVPMSLYYGRMVSHEPPTLFFLLLTTFLYLKYVEKKKNLFKYGFFLSLFFSCFYGWPGFYFIPVVLFLNFIDFRKKRFKTDHFFWQLIFFEVLLLLIFFGQIFVANKFSFQPTIDLIKQKNALPYEGGIPYFKLPWLFLLLRRFISFFTPIVAIPGGIYLLYLTGRFFKEKTADKMFLWQKTSLIFTFISLIHVFVWRCGSNLPYWQIYFLPALVFTATYIFLSGEKLIRKIFPPKIFLSPLVLMYYLFIFYNLIKESQPIVWELYTKGGTFSFPHFFVQGF